MYLYDIALSYASEQYDYVSRVYKYLKKLGLSVYFAPKEQEQFAGNDLTDILYAVFHDQSRMAAAFVSTEYLSKEWTRQEAAILMQRSRETGRNCLIPVYFGAARLPGFDKDIGWLSADQSELEVAYYLAEAARRMQMESAQEQMGGEERGRAPNARSSSAGPEGKHANFYFSGGTVHITQAHTITNSQIQCGASKEED